MKEITDLRLRISLEEAENGPRRMSLGLRRDAGRAALRLKSGEGLSFKKFAKELGASPTTLATWIDLARGKHPTERGGKASARKKEAAVSKIRPVRILDSLPAADGLNVLLPSGISIRGLSVDQVAALDKALS